MASASPAAGRGVIRDHRGEPVAGYADYQFYAEREYWERLGWVVPEKTERVWSALEKALFKYNDTLKERASTIEEVAGLQQQNTELKNLLSQYLGSRVNDDLIVPPTQMIKVTPAGRT